MKKLKNTYWKNLQDAPRIGSNPLIFSSPELQHLEARILWGVATLAMWLLGIYFLSPLMTLVLWLVTSFLDYAQLIDNDIYLKTMSVIKVYIYAITIIGLIMTVKLAMNVQLEKLKVKRLAKNQSTILEIQKSSDEADDQSKPQSRFMAASSYKRMKAHHDHNGQLINVVNLNEPSFSPS
jgi:poly-beta-1,6-N-acetyl-D-glucosamine biosynthesis protein PgaD